MNLYTKKGIFNVASNKSIKNEINPIDTSDLYDSMYIWISK